MGASFGGGGSQTLFGAAGGGSLLTRATAVLAATFFVTSFGLAVLAKQKASDIGAVDDLFSEAAINEGAAGVDAARADLEAQLDQLPEPGEFDQGGTGSDVPLDDRPLDIVDTIPQ